MARRRANGEGCIRKRKDGTWEARITLGYDPFGKQVTKSVYGRTQRDVKEKLERLKADLEGGLTERPYSLILIQIKIRTRSLGRRQKTPVMGFVCSH